MHSFIYSIITIHSDPQHGSSIAVLIFRKTIGIFTVSGIVTLEQMSGLMLLKCGVLMFSSVTIPDTVNIQIVLLKISTEMLETC
jgi:hypothetical protein